MDKLKILAVDDNTVNLATIEQELKVKYDVIPMISGRRALQYLYKDIPDLILLDVEMPVMDGIETLKEIRALGNGDNKNMSRLVTLPVIFLTAKKDKYTVVEGQKLGIMDYIVKPFDPQYLSERIERVFKRLGVLPMEEDELFKRVMKILMDMKTGNAKQAQKLIGEVLNYQVEEEVSGRIRTVLAKLKQGDEVGAVAMMERVVDYLNKKLASTQKFSTLPISESDISVRILYAIDDISNFKRKEAVEKLKELQKYDVGHYVLSVVDDAISLLDDYDDVSAENRLQTLLNDLKNVSAAELGSAGGHGTGFHSRIGV